MSYVGNAEIKKMKFFSKSSESSREVSITRESEKKGRRK